MSQTISESRNSTPPVEDRGAVKQQTTYVVLRTITPEDGMLAFREVGRYRVPAGRSDQAKQQALEQLAAAEPDTTAFGVVAVPAKSWQVETFTLEVPQPRFRKA